MFGSEEMGELWYMWKFAERRKNALGLKIIKRDYNLWNANKNGDMLFIEPLATCYGKLCSTDGHEKDLLI